MADPQNAQLREAIQELSLYLSDTLPPLVVSDSISLLLQYPPTLVANQIQAWTGTQYRTSEIPVSDYLFHAVRKIHMMGEFNLVPREGFIAYLEGLKTEVLALCPEEDRDFLRESLDRLGEPSGAMAPSVDNLLRQRRPALATDAGSGQDLMNSRRMSLLIARLEREIHAGGSLDLSWKDRPAAAQTLAAAARGARSAQDIDQMLERLRTLGLDIGTSDVFRSLGKNLPGWVPPPSARGLPAEEVPTASGVEAMRKIVTLSENPAEGVHRFHEMVRAAIERFNDGSLAQAVTMIELGKRLIDEGTVDAKSAETIRGKEDENLDTERLRRYAEATDQHSLLRDFLTFFTRLAPDGLLADLQSEPKRERRRLLLLLLEVHGTPARELVLERLRTPIGQASGDQDWYFRRNLLYLLRRIPRPADASADEDVDVAIKHTELRFPAPLVKEGIATLGQWKHERSERTLVGLLGDLEAMLGKPAGTTAYDPREARLLLDRVVAALARFGTTGARRAVVEHGLKSKPELGDSVARLAELSGQDLSGDGDLLEKMLAAVKANMPFKLFGLVLKKDRNLPTLVEALSGTPHPAVKEILEEVIKRFPGDEAGKAASKALEAFAHAPAAASEGPGAGPSLTGDLELFGLPAVLQSLSDSGVSGSMTLRSPKGDIFGTIILRGGKLKSCQTGRLVGEEAFYQLLERPVPGSFLFARQSDGAGEEPRGSLREILPLTLEGMRRFDELQQAAVLVPDDAAFKPTSIKPTPHPGEKDGILVNDLWTRVSRSATARQCEAEIRADSYRIRRLLAHWVVSGALAGA